MFKRLVSAIALIAVIYVSAPYIGLAEGLQPDRLDADSIAQRFHEVERAYDHFESSLRDEQQTPLSSSEAILLYTFKDRELAAKEYEKLLPVELTKLRLELDVLQHLLQDQSYSDEQRLKQRAGKVEEASLRMTYLNNLLELWRAATRGVYSEALTEMGITRFSELPRNPLSFEEAVAVKKRDDAGERVHRPIPFTLARMRQVLLARSTKPQTPPKLKPQVQPSIQEQDFAASDDATSTPPQQSLGLFSYLKQKPKQKGSLAQSEPTPSVTQTRVPLQPSRARANSRSAQNSSVETQPSKKRGSHVGNSTDIVSTKDAVAHAEGQIPDMASKNNAKGVPSSKEGSGNSDQGFSESKANEDSSPHAHSLVVDSSASSASSSLGWMTSEERNKQIEQLSELALRVQAQRDASPIAYGRGVEYWKAQAKKAVDVYSKDLTASGFNFSEMFLETELAQSKTPITQWDYTIVLSKLNAIEKEILDPGPESEDLLKRFFNIRPSGNSQMIKLLWGNGGNDEAVAKLMLSTLAKARATEIPGDPSTPSQRLAVVKAENGFRAVWITENQTVTDAFTGERLTAESISPHAAEVRVLHPYYWLDQFSSESGQVQGSERYVLATLKPQSKSTVVASKSVDKPNNEANDKAKEYKLRRKRTVVVRGKYPYGSSRYFEDRDAPDVPDLRETGSVVAKALKSLGLTGAAEFISDLFNANLGLSSKEISRITSDFLDSPNLEAMLGQLDKSEDKKTVVEALSKHPDRMELLLKLSKTKNGEAMLQAVRDYDAQGYSIREGREPVWKKLKDGTFGLGDLMRVRDQGEFLRILQRSASGQDGEKFVTGLRRDLGKYDSASLDILASYIDKLPAGDSSNVKSLQAMGVSPGKVLKNYLTQLKTANPVVDQTISNFRTLMGDCPCSDSDDADDVTRRVLQAREEEGGVFLTWSQYIELSRLDSGYREGPRGCWQYEECSEEFERKVAQGEFPADQSLLIVDKGYNIQTVYVTRDDKDLRTILSQSSGPARREAARGLIKRDLNALISNPVFTKAQRMIQHPETLVDLEQGEIEQNVEAVRRYRTLVSTLQSENDRENNWSATAAKFSDLPKPQATLFVAPKFSEWEPLLKRLDEPDSLSATLFIRTYNLIDEQKRAAFFKAIATEDTHFRALNVALDAHEFRIHSESLALAEVHGLSAEEQVSQILGRLAKGEDRPARNAVIGEKCDAVKKKDEEEEFSPKRHAAQSPRRGQSGDRHLPGRFYFSPQEGRKGVAAQPTIPGDSSDISARIQLQLSEAKDQRSEISPELALRILLHPRALQAYRITPANAEYFPNHNVPISYVHQASYKNWTPEISRAFLALPDRKKHFGIMSASIVSAILFSRRSPGYFKTHDPCSPSEIPPDLAPILLEMLIEGKMGGYSLDHPDWVQWDDAWSQFRGKYCKFDAPFVSALPN